MANNNHADREYAVIGLGDFGASLARRLASMGHPVLGIDQDAERVQSLADELADVAILDATNDDALNEVNITSFHTVVVAISGDFAANALITSSLKRMGIVRVICQTATPRHRDILDRIGADMVILPYEESGSRLAEMLSTAGILGYITLGSEHILVQAYVPGAYVSKTIDSACERQHISVLLVQRGDELMISPSLATVLEPYDMVFVVGARSAVTRWLER